LFVNLAVAVVVYIVADLLLRLIERKTLELSVSAVEGPLTTRANGAGIAITSTARVHFVHLTVAVVVDAVTQLGAGIAESETNHVAIATHCFPDSTCAEFVCHAGESSIGITLIDIAVTIVIEFVACLRQFALRLDVYIGRAFDPARDTLDEAVAAEPLIAR